MNDLISIILVAIGCVVMIQTYRKGRGLEPNLEGRQRFYWRVTLNLMVGFIFGYIASIILIISGHQEIFSSLTAAIYLSGAVFVYVTISQTVASLTDKIDKIESMQIQLIQAAKMSSLGTMAAGVAHELNNPLTGIRGFAQLIIKRGFVEQKDLEYTKRIVASTERMHAIIDHLRTFSRVSKSDDWRPVSLVSVITAALELINNQLLAKHIRVSINCNSEEPLLVKGDPVQLESVFQNLLTNSRDAFDAISNRDENRIEITAQISGNHIFITYEDNAGGIPQEHLEKIFDPFFTTKPAGVGTGLGMSISRSILSDHDGSINASSMHGKGTTFTIELPALHESIQFIRGQAESEDHLVSAIRKVSSVFRVLVVDDDTDVCDVIKAYLEPHFYVEATTSPITASQLLRSHEYDILVTDLKMPGLSGVQLINSAKAQHPNLPVLLISGHARLDDDLQEALDEGVDGFLAKPFESDVKLRDILWDLIHRSKAA